jgi:hypothetical protein
VFEPPRSGPTLWEIGVPDRSAAEFFVPDADPKYASKLFLGKDKSVLPSYPLGLSLLTFLNYRITWQAGMRGSETAALIRARPFVCLDTQVQAVRFVGEVRGAVPWKRSGFHRRRK